MFKFLQPNEKTLNKQVEEAFQRFIDEGEVVKEEVGGVVVGFSFHQLVGGLVWFGPMCLRHGHHGSAPPVLDLA